MRRYNPPAPHPDRFCTNCQQWHPRDDGEMVNMANNRQRWVCSGCLKRRTK